MGKCIRRRSSSLMSFSFAVMRLLSVTRVSRNFPSLDCEQMCRKASELDQACLLGMEFQLPVLAHGASMRARGLRPRGTDSTLAVARRIVLPSVRLTTSASRKLVFAARCPGPHLPCQRFAYWRERIPHRLPSRAQTHDSGPSGSLLLSRNELSSSTPCRFIPAP